MASIRREILTKASVETVWGAVRDVGALHTRLVPGFVIDTKLEGNARLVTFGNGMVIREPIVSIDDNVHRLVWTAEGGRTTHYNASLEVLDNAGFGARIIWTADFLPDEAAETIAMAMSAGAAVMKKTLDRLSG
jgi:hypothetical protein